MREGAPRRNARHPAARGLPDLLVLAPGIALAGLGVLFLVAPRLGATLFGIPAPDGPGILYVRAIGLRDIALAAYLAGLARFGSRRGLGLVLALTMVIPIGDLALVAAHRGFSGSLLLHGASLLYFGAAALWFLRGGGVHRNQG